MATLVSDRQGVLTRCSSCGKTNRLRYAHLNRAVRCGGCHATLPPPGQPVEATDVAAFDEMLHAPVPVVVDFWAPWCGPCRVMAPQLETAARNMAGRALVIKVNTDGLPELGERYRIRSIPTLALFRDGREVSRAAGVRPAAEIESLVTQT